MLNTLLNGPGMLGGVRVVIRDPVPMYKRVMMFKKHRRKSNWTRVKAFSHWQELIEDGQVLNDTARGVMYMNRRTHDQLRKAI